MSTKDKNISVLETNSGKGLTIGVVKAKWNAQITDSLAQGAIETLKKYGTDVFYAEVPGTVELTYGAKKMFQEQPLIDAVIVLGCVIQGETRHFDFVCESVTKGITELNLSLDIPIIFGVLTTNNQQQAIDRAGGKYGNKGEECAVAAIEMAKLNIRKI